MSLGNNFDANFTAGGLLFNEFNSLENILLDDDFEGKIQLEEEKNSVIGITTMSARKRIIAEIIRRHSKAPIGFWNYFFQWNQQEQKFGLLYLCFKTYPLILDIHIEVALKKFKTGNTMSAFDVQMRLDEIAANNDYVGQWSSMTLGKINVQYRKAIKDVGIYDGHSLITPAKISPSYWKYYENLNESWFLTACFIQI
jgi:hypothetical protein